MLLTINQVCEKLSVSRSTVYRWWKWGAIPAPVKIEGALRWREAELAKWVEDGCQPLIQLEEQEHEQNVKEAHEDSDWTADVK